MGPDEQEPEPTLPPAEQMRARRLAKLGASTTSSSSATATEGKSDTKENESPKPSSDKPSSLVASTSQTNDTRQAPEAGSQTPTPAAAPAAPRSQPAAKTAAEPATPASQGTKPQGVIIPKRPKSDVDLPAVRPQKIQKQESPEDWADRTISHFFRVTLDPSRKTDVSGHPVTYLPNLASELQEDGANDEAEGRKPLLSQDNLDGTILEAASAFPHNKPLLDYLLPCWKRILRFSKSPAMQRDPPPERLELVKEARRLCMSNALFALTVPDLFGREENPRHDTLVPYLLKGMDNEAGVCLDFLAELVSRFDEDESYADILVRSMVDISAKVANMTMADDYRPGMNVLIMFSKYKEIMQALVKDERFVNKQAPAPRIELDSLLGPFFRLSPLQSDMAKSYFPNADNMNEGAVRTAQNAVQVTLSAHQFDLMSVINNFVRANEEVRGRVLDWFAHVVNSNHKRRAMQVDPKEVSSDGFMLNVTFVVNELCQPFMDTTFSKVGRIDIDYLRRSPRVDLKEETKLNADQQQSDAFYAEKAEGANNFISEIFFLGLAAHNYGTQAISEKMKTMDRAIRNFRRSIEEFETERENFANTRPTQLAAFDLRTSRYREALETSVAMKHATNGVLTDEKMQAKSITFMRYVTVWLLRVASQSDYTPEKRLQVPLASPPPEVFCCLPEYSLQIVLDNFKYVFNTMPQILLSAVGDELTVLCVTLLESSAYIRNPYMKAALVTLLYFGVTQFFRHWKSGVMTDVLMSSKFANDHLLHALMKFYIECESTGANSAFYDKFNIRYEISYIIQKVWPNPHYSRQLREQSKTNKPFFVHFVNMLLNDATYVLDEALTKFQKIHELQVELKEAHGMSEEQRRQKQDELQTTEGHATSYMHLTNQTVAMMKLFTDTLDDAFTMPEIVQRLAGMLDYNLELLVGPKSSKLKVDNPQQYRFQPKTLLAEITDIYLNLGGKPTFIEAVAGDGRSYKPETFAAASRIMANRGFADPEKLSRWAQLTVKIAAAKELADQAEQDFGEIPTEYEDPLMSDLMKDPVRLPSGNIVDRSTIMQHLLSDPKDPFTRQPMSIEDIVPCDDLRVEIEKWKSGRMAAAREKLAAIADGTASEELARAAAADPDAMDTSQ
ncbi:hypothetical protein MCOR02_008633 [Pyricularia oryzae]|uniref:U-box domain-containing protein n=1 Tax=Pyricularia oryzae TaxID=318829 RepID=A0A4P7NGA0_PYROR|nr:hypothetical protein MCOR02_008633 [Pyricularia oryzae]KAI6261899.1 hypothetical protein MCOR19_001850 [Pyricularia oryzae]KAI6287911.1 hypothetical protein MCOR26_000325 [Pyricularia oryzae]KAI6316081.1 hypothetical protein MCOR30_009445 [Pyricularia oryzae]KAI6378833.1 hypothetical protein MCOR31_000478 [Pyricularia oryzae]